MHTSHAIRIGTVILAAGSSTRMGRPKLLLPWGETSVLGHLLEQWGNAGAEQIAVVMAGGSEIIAQELDRLKFPARDRIINPAPERGMFSSIQCAARWPGWKTDLSHCVLALGDQPHLQQRTLAALLDLGARHPEKVCQLSRQGHRRHPVLFPAGVFREMANSTHQNLKEHLQRITSEVALEESDDAGLDLDIDYPLDYEQAMRLSHLAVT